MADLTYGAAGRPQSVTLADSDVSEECARTGRILFASCPFSPLSAGIHVHGSTPEPAPERVQILFLEKTEPLPVRAGSSTLKEPKKLKDVLPHYPAIARMGGVEGAVVLDATIDREGRVTDAVVLRGPSPVLNNAAREAVLQWKYTPTLLDGVPVPVLLTVLVNFSIAR